MSNSCVYFQKANEMNPVSIVRTCRYGHGPLVHINKMIKSNVTFGLVMHREGAVETGVLNGLSFWVCKSCGYSEVVDDDVAQTLLNMDARYE